MMLRNKPRVAHTQRMPICKRSHGSVTNGALQSERLRCGGFHQHARKEESAMPP